MGTGSEKAVEGGNASAPRGATWDLSSFFPVFDGPEMRAFKTRLANDVRLVLQEACEAGPLASDPLERWEHLLLRLEDIEARASHLAAYLECLAAADAADEAVRREEGSLARLAAEVEKIEVEIVHAIKAAPEQDFQALLGREALRGAEHRLKRLRRRAAHTMSRAEERLQADLAVDGLHAWGRLYNTTSGKLTFEMRWPDGRLERIPMAQWRSLMSSADRAVGRAAFEGGNRAWDQVADVCAAALNAIAGARLTLHRYRGYEHYLEPALEQAQVDPETLEAMYTAIWGGIELPRRICKARAAAMGRGALWFFEREAPLPLESAAELEWRRAVEMVSTAFSRRYPALAEYLAMALDRRWVESEKRPGKRPGAFCTGSLLSGEQRVYMTFAGALRDASTLAHEIGHAWHGWLMRSVRPMAHSSPMTLAETASVFAELLLAEAIAEDESLASPWRLLVLDSALSDAAVMLLDITVRYEFERALYDERREGELTVSRLKDLMSETQRRVWADALAPGGEDPLFWASKLHFYITETTFYNFPYTFGFLLALALARMARERGAGFFCEYERFLARTGSGTAEEIVHEAFGEDIRRPEFWARSIASLAEPLARYQQMLAELGGPPGGAHTGSVFA